MFRFLSLWEIFNYTYFKKGMIETRLDRKTYLHEWVAQRANEYKLLPWELWLFTAEKTLVYFNRFNEYVFLIFELMALRRGGAASGLLTQLLFIHTFIQCDSNPTFEEILLRLKTVHIQKKHWSRLFLMITHRAYRVSATQSSY